MQEENSTEDKRDGQVVKRSVSHMCFSQTKRTSLHRAGMERVPCPSAFLGLAPGSGSHTIPVENSGKLSKMIHDPPGTHNTCASSRQKAAAPPILIQAHAPNITIHHSSHCQSMIKIKIEPCSFVEEMTCDFDT